MRATESDSARAVDDGTTSRRRRHLAVGPGARASLDDGAVDRRDGRAMLGRGATSADATAECGAFVAEDVTMGPAGGGSA
ncbi:hypothetical protein NIIDMKKI_69490 [Mycobacterium kansasii]|uniref:Uncharacterized protein n=1 Tax=Mycobacterium kansasii TaxID=1768 RepID=A0A1V3WSH5_MYCKA|nr:hypothetical protein BZL29_6224 [Mycobacterium kansasii]BCI91743.1 hypothetical protein NIIDMKKI_69490 [Mycobacterium kansasii]